MLEGDFRGEVFCVLRLRCVEPVEVRKLEHVSRSAYNEPVFYEAL